MTPQDGRFLAVLARLATTIVGVLLIVYGLVAAVSPLPVGVPLAVLGLIVIAAANPAARPLIVKLRRRWRWFDVLVRKAAQHSPPRFRQTINETDPALRADPAHRDEDG